MDQLNKEKELVVEENTLKQQELEKKDKMLEVAEALDQASKEDNYSVAYPMAGWFS